MSVSAILLAAGRGRRMELGTNKVFLDLAGTPILTRAARAICSAPRVSELIVVALPDELAMVAGLVPPLGIPVRVVAGGERRQDSAAAGVEAASGDWILIHDAARPFPSLELIERVIDGARRHGACVPVIPAVDALRRLTDDGFLSPDSLDRTRLFAMQTPQGFDARILRQAIAHRSAGELLPDDASWVLAIGHPVATVAGEPWNLKITSPADSELARRVAIGAGLH